MAHGTSNSVKRNSRLFLFPFLKMVQLKSLYFGGKEKIAAVISEKEWPTEKKSVKTQSTMVKYK